MKEDRGSCLFKDIRINKAFWRSQWNTHKLKWVMLFIVGYEFSVFVLVATFLTIDFLNFLLSLLMHISTQHVLSNVLLCWCLASGKPTAWLFNSSLIPGDQAQKLRSVLAAYLLCRCKHLSIFFRVVNLSKTKQVYILQIAGYDINFIIWFQWCKGRFIFRYILIEYIKT